MKDELLKIINYYGLIKQLKYFQSEVFELNEAIIRHNNRGMLEDITNNICKVFISDYKDASKEHIIEEIADVQVMLSQFKEYYDITDEEIEKVMKYKVERQLERIENEKSKAN